MAIQCAWNLDPSVHWNATGEMPVCFRWSSIGFPVVFQCVPIMQINTGSPLGHHWVLASASVVPVASQCTCGSTCQSQLGVSLGLHLGSKMKFSALPRNNCTWKCKDYSVWNPNFAKLSLIFIEIHKFENPSLTRHFRVGGATQCWYDIHFYWVLLMIIFNWTY